MVQFPFQANTLFLSLVLIGKLDVLGFYRKRGRASYIVREVRSVREREKERERERNGSDVTLLALKLGSSFALFFLPKTCTLVNGAEFTLSVAKNVALFETVPILRKTRTLRFTSVKWLREKWSKHRNKLTIDASFRLHRPSSHRKNESN